MERLHYNSDRSLVVKDVSVVGHPVLGKPEGLWYSIGPAWLEWVKSEMPQWLPGYSCAHRLILDEDRILKIGTTYGEMAKFHKRYGSIYKRDLLNEQTFCFDWERVRNDGYGGIEFFPYERMAYSFGNWIGNLPELRFWLGMFVSSLDIPSGCIWDASIVKSVEGPFNVGEKQNG